MYPTDPLDVLAHDWLVDTHADLMEACAGNARNLLMGKTAEDLKEPIDKMFDEQVPKFLGSP